MNKLTVRFHSPITLFGKEVSHINPVQDKALSVTVLDSGWIRISNGERVALLPPSTVETIHMSAADEAVS